MGLRRQVSQLSGKLLIQLPRKLPCWSLEVACPGFGLTPLWMGGSK